jgi:hypothetical protein
MFTDRFGVNIQAFAGFLNPEVAAKVNLYVALAPIAYLGNIKSVMLKDLGTVSNLD